MARIAGVNLPVQKHRDRPAEHFGVGRSRSKCHTAGVNPATKIKDLTEAEVDKLHEIGRFTVQGRSSPQ